MDYPDTHLQSAIRRDERKYAFTCDLSQCPTYLRPYVVSCPLEKREIRIDSELTYGKILSIVYDTEVEILKWVKHHLPTALEVSCKIVHQCLTKVIPNLTLDNLIADNYMMKLVSASILWEDLRARMQSLLTSPGTWQPAITPLHTFREYYVCGKFLLIRESNCWFCYSYDQVMMISDTVWARSNVLLYHHLLPSNYTSKVPPAYIEECYRIFDSCFPDFGNNIYDGIKSWESLILGSLVEDYDPYNGGSEFLIPVLDEMNQLGFHCVKRMYKYIKSLKLKPDQYSELHGLNRHWGHPTVDEIGACHKTRLISQHRPVPNFNTLHQAIGCLKRQFIVSFIQKHGRWPSIINSDRIKNKVLKSMVITHARHLNLYQTNITLKDWFDLQFGKEMEFDYHLDYTELLDDKAISPYKNNVRSLFNPTILGYFPPKPKQSRRLLRAILEIDKLSIEEIIDKIRMRQIPEEWFIVILHSKERELKLKPRLFAMLVLEIRMYFAVTEKNIAKSIFPYFPQQTMTMSESELCKRIYKFTEQQPIQSYIPFYVMIDFKSWNIHWSQMSTIDGFQFIDSLFGTPGLYTFTHEYFSKCMMVLSSSLLPPSSLIGIDNAIGVPRECETLWYNHHGGWDGLRQKGWTTITIALLLLVEHLTGIQSQIVGQADNQICKIFIPREPNELSTEEYIKLNLPTIKEKIKVFTDTLDKVVSDVGLVLKKEESLVSSSLTIYGKEMTLNGAQLSQASKKISRALAEINTTVPSLFSKTLTLHSSGLSTAQKTHLPIIPCIMANMLSLINFINGARYSLLTRKKNPNYLWDWIEGEAAMTFLLLGSGDAGGAPMQNILNYLYRGHPDTLTAYTTYLHTLTDQSDIALRIYLYLQLRMYSIGDADPELLVSNPCSTNIESFPLVSSRYRRTLEKLIQSRTRNHDLHGLFPSTSQDDDKEVFRFLLQFDPLQPRLIHEIFRLTPTCSRLTFLAKFSNTRTVHMMLKEEQRRGEYADDIWDPSDYATGRKIDIIVSDIDVSMLSHLKQMYTDIRSQIDLTIPLICPTLLAKDLRQYSWEGLIGNRQIDGVTIPHPVHQFTLSFCTTNEHTTCKGEMEYCYLTPLQENPVRILTERGSLPPYIGSRTREKVTGKIYSIPTTARPFKAAERAIILGDWCVDPKSSLQVFLSNLITSRTDMNEGDLRKVAGRITGGTSIHRLDSHMGPTCTLNNSLANITTHILFSTDTMGRFSQGRENYVMHFQGIIHTGISLLNIFIGSSGEVPQVAHLHYTGKCCEELIDEALVGGLAAVPPIPTYPDNPLLYTKITQLSQDKMESLKGIAIEDHIDSSWALAFILLSRIRTRILSTQWGVTETSSPTVSSLGVQEILRIGLKRIVRSLAKVLYLHLDYNDDYVELLLQSLSTDIWSDIVHIILIPDVLVPTMEYLNIDGVPDAYINPQSVARCLNNKLIQEVTLLKNNPSKAITVLPFHLYGNIRLPHILRMWGKVVYIGTNQQVDLRPIIRDILANTQKTSDIPTTASSPVISQIIIQVLRKYSTEGYVAIWKDHPLKVCYKPPETLLRIDPFPLQQLKSIKVFPLADLRTNLDSYILSVDMVPASTQLSYKKIEYVPGDIPSRQKIRNDHMYRYIGQVSTAYLKYMEILLQENIQLNGTAICTADGESSVGFLLYKLTGNPIIYNSLVDKQHLQPQRGYTYIPGSFLKYPHAVLNAENNCTLGGDITNLNLQKTIIACAAAQGKPICLITCDAESSINFSTKMTLDILLSVIHVAFKTKSQQAIIKTYVQDTTMALLMGGLLQLVWAEVRLVTPCFSSHESAECFWVCKSFSPSSKCGHLQSLWRDKGKLLVPESCHQTSTYIQEFIDKRTTIKSPLQQLRARNRTVLMKNAKHLGFKENVPQAFDIITNNNLHYDLQLPLEKNIKEGMLSLQHMLFDYLKGMKRVYEGKPLDLEIGARVGKTHVIHSVLESYMIGYRNLLLVLKLTESPYDIEYSRSLIDTHLKTLTPVHDSKGKLIYEYADLNERTWRKRYLKPIWKLVGKIVLEDH